MSWTKSEKAGIYRHETIDNKWQIRATATNPETGQVEERQKTLTDTTLEEAIATRESLKNEIQTVEPDKGSSTGTPLLVDFATQWTARKKKQGQWSERTYSAHKQILEDHILPRIGGFDVDDLQRDDIRRWIDYIEGKTYEKNGEQRRYTHDSLRRFWATMKHLVKALYLEGHCDRRFFEWCREIPGPRSDISGRRETKTLTLEELGEFVETAREKVPKWYPHIATLAYTGMRYGESAGLEWKDLDFAERTLCIRRSFSQGRLGPPKTGKTRVIGMAEPVAEALQMQRDRLHDEDNIGLVDDIVFPSDKGTRRWSSSLHGPMREAAKAAGIDVKVGPQVLRKTLATVLDNAGVQRKMIKAIAGHETDEMSDHYDEKRPEDQIRALSSILEEARAK
jgi:integrase